MTMQTEKTNGTHATTAPLTRDAADRIMAQAEAPTFAFSDDEKRVIRDIYAKGATDAEYSALVTVAEARGLDPRLGHCHFVKRKDKAAGREVWSVQASIDGLRAQAERTGDYDGQDEPDYIHDQNGNLRVAKVRVYRKGISRPFVGVAHFEEYVQKTYEGNPTRFWNTMPHVMLAKCAEALAIRKAFPAQLAGLYTPEEMGQAENDAPPRGGFQTTRDMAASEMSAAIASANPLTVGDWRAKFAACGTMAGLQSLAAQIKALPAEMRTALRPAYDARKRELTPRDDGPKGGAPKPAAPEQTDATGDREVGADDDADAPMAWTPERWTAHVDTHSSPFAVAQSYAKHSHEFAVRDPYKDIAARRMVALGHEYMAARALLTSREARVAA